MKSQNNINNAYFETLRHKGDDLADSAFIALKSDAALADQFYALQTNKQFHEAEFQNPLINSLLTHIKSYCQASSQSSFQSGQHFFSGNALEILGMLGFYSLPYCYAGAKGVRVLYHSKKIKENPEKRLIETAQFVFDVCSPESFELEGKGLVSVLKVRIMHAGARYYAKSVITDEVPVNQEDLLATLLSFSLISIRGLRKTGIEVSKKQALDFVSMWNVIGKMMGIEESIVPETLEESSHVERLIRKRQFSYSNEGEELTNSLIAYLSEQKLEGLTVDPKAFMFFLMGKEVSANIGLGSQSIFKMAMLESVARVRSFFNAFSQQNYPALKKQFDQNVERMNARAEFRAV